MATVTELHEFTTRMRNQGWGGEELSIGLEVPISYVNSAEIMVTLALENGAGFPISWLKSDLSQIPYDRNEH